MSGAIQAITMPKWGLAMDEGVVTEWSVAEGDDIVSGQEIIEIETTKIANGFESPASGVLRRIVAAEGETVVVGGLLGVVSAADVGDEEIDAFVADFLARFVPAEAGGAGGPEAEVVEAGGHRLRRLKVGPEDGTPILLLHGFGADLESWAFNQGDLAASRPVHAIDLPGHGGSGKTLQGGDARSLSDAVVAYLVSEDLSGVHLVGHSLGGTVAVHAARAVPERVQALSLIAPAGMGPEIAGDFISGFLSETRARKLRAVLEMLVADPTAVTADMVENVLRFKRIDGAIEALKSIAGSNFNGDRQEADIRGLLGDLSMPVQVIWGEGDRILPARHATGLPGNVRVTVIQGAGHIPHMEKSGDVNRLIEALG